VLCRDEQGALITVADEGIKMTPEQTRMVFDKFYRANNLDTAAPGLGRGMNIAKNIIETHGGEIWVESEKGKGTQVHVRLPEESSG
jgi:two-component system sensor histidine kinase VicK